MPSRALPRLAWGVLLYNVAVILWGALVRATGSGAGCGAHWPLCDGVVVPRAETTEQVIEYTHRVTSGLALAAVVALVVLAFRSRPRGHAVRRAAAWSLALVLVEAALGAGLVLYELVAANDSAARAIVGGLHLVNTLLLLAALALTAWLAEGHPAPRLASGPRAASLLFVALALLALTGATGAIAALGDTLYPAGSLGEALAQDVAPAAHALVRLRLAHPAIAAAAAGIVLWLAWRWGVAAAVPERWARAAGGLVLLQIAAGIVNVLLLAPVWLQLVHLLLADLTWIAVVLAGARRLAPQKVFSSADGP